MSLLQRMGVKMNKRKAYRFLRQLEGLIVYPAALGAMFLVLLGMLSWQDIPLYYQVGTGELQTIQYSSQTGLMLLIVGFFFLLILIIIAFQLLFSTAKSIRDKYS